MKRSTLKSLTVNIISTLHTGHSRHSRVLRFSEIKHSSITPLIKDRHRVHYKILLYYAVSADKTI